MIGVGCLQVRCRRHGARMLGMKGRGSKIWWPGDGVGGVGH